MEAGRNSTYNIVEILLNNGANTDLKNNNGIIFQPVQFSQICDKCNDVTSTIQEKNNKN